MIRWGCKSACGLVLGCLLQTPAAAELEEVLITAQKRASEVQAVPLSVVALSSEALLETGVENVLDLPRLVPNLIVNRAGQTANIRMNIRGIGASGNSAMDPSVATFIDDIYVPRTGELYVGFNDLAGVEVVRGPQGTLFGRNSTVGGLILRSADPVDGFGAMAELRGGSDGLAGLSGVINVAASERAALRAAITHESIDGWTENLLDGRTWGARESTAARLGLRWDLADSLSWTLKVDYGRIGGDGFVEQEILPQTLTEASRGRIALVTHGNPPDLADPFDRRTHQRVVGDLDDEQWGLASELAYETPGGYTWRLISGLREWRNRQLDGDVVFLTPDLLTRHGLYDSDSHSQELQVLSPERALLGGRLDFVGGLYFFDEDFRIGEQLSLGDDWCRLLGDLALLPPAALPACVASPGKANATQLDFDQTARSMAAYAEGRLALTDTLSGVIGGRWTRDTKDGTFVQLRNNPFAAPLRAPEDTPLSKEDDHFTWRAGLDWTASENLFLFGSYSTGYKSGGFSSGGGNAALGQRRVFEPETSRNIEVGVRSRWAQGRARLNATLYRLDLDQFQDRAFDGTSFTAINAGNLRHQGIEVDGEAALGRGLTATGALAYLDSRFTSYPNASCLPYAAQVNPSCTQDLAGERNIFSPRWQAAAGLRFEGDLGPMGYALRTDGSYTSAMNINSVNDANPQGMEPELWLWSARLSLLFGTQRNWSLSVAGENLTDEGYCANRFYQTLDQALGLRDPVGGGTVLRCIVGAPRTWSVALRAEF